MMEKQRVNYFRAQLVSQREQVLTEMANHQPLLEHVTDIEEKADQAASNFVETRITEHDGNLLEKIDLALKRLDDGTYQQCAQCKEDIPIDRLIAKPSASLCVSCQEKKDKGQLSPS